MAIIGFLSVPGVARLTRAEFIRSRSLDYVQSARALGLRDFRIIFRHILPNAISPVFVYVAFGIASAIVAESSLSFLGIGVPADTVTWGSLLSYARDDYSAWWMAVFPGLAIFITVAMYNLIGEGLREALNPKLNK
jgi:peptide/nickel transport system permease protein